ncbi:hypothetical protein FRX31_035280 [Thalictrum thalictroides]|uniref:GATA-type domain-containing protein n=1 Tax=Thalictrum thalictroides TaxID=46969 RepID=A0A7J6US76_THATH|nr:hypothetical protein FRX31_035280 [Thalictrum thalictroides]
MAIDKTLKTIVETQDSIFGGLEDLQEVIRQSSLYDLYADSILNELSSMEEKDREWLVIPNNLTDDSSISKSRSFSTRQQCEAPLTLVDSSSSTISEQSNVFIEDTEQLSPNNADELVPPHCEAVCRIDSATTSGQDLDSRKCCLADDELCEDTQEEHWPLQKKTSGQDFDSRKRCLADDELCEDTQEEHWSLKKKQRNTKTCGRVWFTLDVNPIPSGRRCRHCGTDKTPLWRSGPGAKDAL